MNTDGQSARDDLAFLRTLVGGDENLQMRTFGEVYFIAGLIYGGQMLLHAAQAMGLLPGAGAVALAIGLGPTVLFIPVLVRILYRDRRNPIRGAVGRAIASIFSALGLANLVLIVVIGSLALHQHSLQTWLLYPCTIFILQGAAWMFTYMMRRHAWHLAVALGWFVLAVAAGLSIPSLPYFILFVGLGLWACMALPGYVLLRRAGRD
ncbi:MAG: hypothetical protein WDN03_08990 [Rhizomicrobium sp.]